MTEKQGIQSAEAQSLLNFTFELHKEGLFNKKHVIGSELNICPITPSPNYFMPLVVHN